VWDELEYVRATSRAEISEMRHQLVGCQNELYRLKGDTASRFAIIQQASVMLNKLKPWLGMEIGESASKSGVRVVNVRPGSPAMIAGVRINDVLESANGEHVQSSNEFKRLITRIRPGDTISLQINREDKMMHLNMKIASNTMSFAGVERIRRVASGVVLDGDEQFLDATTANGSGTVIK